MDEPRATLRVYAHGMRRSERERETLHLLMEGRPAPDVEATETQTRLRTSPKASQTPINRNR